MLFVSALVIALPASAASYTEKKENKNNTATASQPINVSKEENNTVAQEIVSLVNKERTIAGLAPIALDAELTKVAQLKSQDMQSKNYFSHTSPTYGSPFEMMKQFGISYKSAGENIAMGQTTAKQVMDAWMNSEGHRANILDSKFTHIGVGYVEKGHYWTQMFIKK